MNQSQQQIDATAELMTKMPKAPDPNIDPAGYQMYSMFSEYLPAIREQAVNKISNSNTDFNSKMSAIRNVGAQLSREWREGGLAYSITARNADVNSKLSEISALYKDPKNNRTAINATQIKFLEDLKGQSDIYNINDGSMRGAPQVQLFPNKTSQERLKEIAKDVVPDDIVEMSTDGYYFRKSTRKQLTPDEVNALENAIANDSEMQLIVEAETIVTNHQDKTMGTQSYKKDNEHLDNQLKALKNATLSQKAQFLSSQFNSNGIPLYSGNTDVKAGSKAAHQVEEAVKEWENIVSGKKAANQSVYEANPKAYIYAKKMEGIMKSWDMYVKEEISFELSKDGTALDQQKLELDRQKLKIEEKKAEMMQMILQPTEVDDSALVGAGISETVDNNLAFDVMDSDIRYKLNEFNYNLADLLPDFNKIKGANRVEVAQVLWNSFEAANKMNKGAPLTPDQIQQVRQQTLRGLSTLYKSKGVEATSDHSASRMVDEMLMAYNETASGSITNRSKKFGKAFSGYQSGGSFSPSEYYKFYRDIEASKNQKIDWTPSTYSSPLTGAPLANDKPAQAERITASREEIMKSYYGEDAVSNNGLRVTSDLVAIDPKSKVSESIGVAIARAGTNTKELKDITSSEVGAKYANSPLGSVMLLSSPGGGFGKAIYVSGTKEKKNVSVVNISDDPKNPLGYKIFTSLQRAGGMDDYATQGVNRVLANSSSDFTNSIRFKNRGSVRLSVGGEKHEQYTIQGTVMMPYKHQGEILQQPLTILSNKEGTKYEIVMGRPDDLDPDVKVDRAVYQKYVGGNQNTYATQRLGYIKGSSKSDAQHQVKQLLGDMYGAGIRSDEREVQFKFGKQAEAANAENAALLQYLQSSSN